MFSAMNKEFSSFLSQLFENCWNVLEKIFNLFEKPRTNFEMLAFVLILLAAFYYTLVFSTYSILTHETFSTSAYDVGLFDQGIWQLSRFRAPFTTIKGVNLLGDHSFFYTIFLAPLYWVWANVNFLYVIQSLFLALGAIPLFLYARRKLENSFLALAVGISFLLYPALQNMNLENFHPETLATFFMIMSLYFLLLGNFHLFYPFIILSLLGKEDISITIAFIGLYLIAQKNLKHGIITLLIGLSSYFTFSRLIMPLLNGISIFSPQPLAYSYWFQGLTSNLFNPKYYWSNFFHRESLEYYRNLLQPVAFIPIFGPQILVLAFPSLAMNVLAGGYLRSINYHYNYLISGIIFFSLIEGLYFLQKLLKARWLNGAAKAAILGSILLFFAYTSNNTLSLLPLNKHLSLIFEKYRCLSSETIKTKRRALKLISKEAKVSASYLLVPHLTHRKEIYMFPNPFKSVLWNMWFKEGKDAPPSEGHIDYVILDLDAYTSEEEKLIIRYLLDSPYYQKVYDNYPILVLKHTDYKREGNLGANYLLYTLDKQVSLIDDFSKKLKIKKKGILSMLYFPDSNYYLRNLLGENIPVESQFALEIFGYLFIPKAGEYKFNIQSDAQALIEVNGEIYSLPLFLKKGFHKYRIKYLNYGQKYNLKFTVSPPHGLSYIISDRDLRVLHPIPLAKTD